MQSIALVMRSAVWNVNETGANKPSVVVNNTFNDSDGESVLKALPAMRQMIIDAVSGNIASNRQIRKTMQAYA